MNIFQQMEQEKSNIIDPIVLFGELSELIFEPIESIATAFIRLNTLHASLSNINFYEYDSIHGIKKTHDYTIENQFINAIARGYKRVIITDEIDDYWVGFWGLSKNGELEYDINGINAFQPFYFIREEVSDFLKEHKIPLPQCITNSDNISDKDDDYLKRFLSRPTIQIKEAANIIAGLDPHYGGFSRDAESNYYSMWEAIDKRLLTASNITWAELEDKHGGTRRDNATLVTNEVANWARMNGYIWPLPIDKGTKESNQENVDLLQRINQLEQELQAQKNNSESVYISPLNIVDTSNLERENNQLKIDNQNITEQLNDAKKEIEKLNQFIQSNNITELTEEYLKLRERNNYHSLIGGLLFLLLKDAERNLNQNTVIVSLQEKFKGEPFSDRSLQDKFANAKRQLLSNHPNIKFD